MPEESGTIRIAKKKVYLTVGFIIVFLIGFAFGWLVLHPTGAVVGISSSDAGQKLVDFLNSRVGGGVSLVNVETQDSLYKVTVSYQGEESPVYMTKDGKYFILGLEEITQVNQQTQTQQTQTNIPKSDKPKVELFVMAYCPYGTQSEKGILPVVKLLGDKIDFKIKFVYYAMHGEKEVYEQLKQYCIQKEQADKYLDYLECFLKDGKGDKCLTEAGVDKTKLNSCTEKADKEFDVTANLENKDAWLSGTYPKFDIFKADNEKYGIRGSPSLVINNVRLASSRADCSEGDEQAGKCIVYPISRFSEAYKKAICNAFSQKPTECQQKLSSETPGPGFGYSVSASGSKGSCE